MRRRSCPRNSTFERGQQAKAEERGDDRRLIIERLPDSSDLVLAEHSLARAIWRGALDHVAWIGLEPLTLDRKVKHLPHQRQGAIRHDRRAALDDLVQQFTHVASLDVFDSAVAPTRHQRNVRRLARSNSTWFPLTRPIKQAAKRAKWKVVGPRG